MAKAIPTTTPTFSKDVSIHVPGKKPISIAFIFKGRTRTEFKAFVEELRDREDVDVILDIATGWELSDTFGSEAIEKLCDTYIAAPRSIIETYLNELSGARLGN